MILLAPDLEPDDDIERKPEWYQELSEMMATAWESGDFEFLFNAGSAITKFARDASFNREELRHPPLVYTEPMTGSRIFIFKCENNGNTYRYSNDPRLIGVTTGYE